MASLKVPCALDKNSASSIFSRRCSVLKGGIVASPTPTVPMASDSTSTTLRLAPISRAIDAAAVHPAVPPPTTTTFCIFLADIDLRFTTIYLLTFCESAVRSAHQWDSTRRVQIPECAQSFPDQD